MSLYLRVVCTVSLLAACGDPPADTATASAEGSASATMPTMPTMPTTVDTGDTTGTPTSTSVGGSATEGATSDGTTADVTSAAETGPGPQTTANTTEPDTTAPGTTTTTDPDPDTGDDTTTTEPDPDTGDDTSTTDTGVTVCECPMLEVPLDDGIFLLSSTAELWKFFPKTAEFVELGTLSCGMFDTFSMAVDRQGFAWVQFVSGELRTVPVGDLTKCEDPGYNAGQMGVNNFGMAFVSNSISDPCDRIYGNTWNGIPPFSESPNAGDFITIDPDTLNLTKLGKTNFNGAEVTGTGDGRAFVFGGANPAKLVQLDKQTAAAIETLPLGGLEINNGAFAFAFFAGDFYFFTDSNNDSFASEVTHLDHDDSDMNGVQDLKKIVDAAPLLIVGAGVSTCAPYAPQ
jgi:hypothetical protein